MLFTAPKNIGNTDAVQSPTYHKRKTLCKINADVWCGLFSPHRLLPKNAFEKRQRSFEPYRHQWSKTHQHSADVRWAAFQQRIVVYVCAGEVRGQEKERGRGREREREERGGAGDGRRERRERREREGGGRGRRRERERGGKGKKGEEREEDGGRTESKWIWIVLGMTIWILQSPCPVAHCRVLN